MTIKQNIIQAILRKLIAAIITSSIFSILFGFVRPDPFGEGITSQKEYIESALLVMPIYLLYSFPVILIYGSGTSILSDFISLHITKKINFKKAGIISFFFHIILGCILLWVSLAASVIFFFTDRLLKKRRTAYQ